MSVTKKASIRRTIFFMSALLCSLLLVAAYVPGCSLFDKKPGKPEGTIIARVGDSYLTLEDLEASIPPEYSGTITRDQNIQYVRQWLNTEVLYQEALRRKIDQEPEIKSRLERMRKDLLSSEIINRASFDVTEHLTEQAVREYYESHREQFTREHNVVRYESIIVDDINLAWEIRRNATHETFGELAREHSKAGPVGTDGSAPYIALDAIPPIIRNAIMAAATPSITGPYRAEDGFHILRVMNKFERGSIATIDEVRDEIATRISNIAQKGETEKMISEIRARETIEFHIDMVPGVDVATAPEDVGGQD